MLGICWWFSGLYPRASRTRRVELENSLFRPRDAGGYVRWGVAGDKLISASSRSEDAPYVACTMSPDQKWIILAVTIQREKMI